MRTVTGMLLALCAASTLHAQDPASSTDASAPNAPQAVTKSIQQAMQDIRRALQSDEGLPADALSVAVHAETIIISGQVVDEATAARALSVAQQQSGGVRVSSHVEVLPKQAAQSQASAEASQLARAVESALRADRRTANLGISVSVDAKQVVGLHGLVPTRESRAAAEEIAAKVGGVQKVSSRLVVAGE